MSENESLKDKENNFLTKPLTTARLEAFSDGVFAIAITLLVLEIKIPHQAAGENNLPLSARSQRSGRLISATLPAS